jgi:hypothetical protein
MDLSADYGITDVSHLLQLQELDVFRDSATLLVYYY